MFHNQPQLAKPLTTSEAAQVKFEKQHKKWLNFRFKLHFDTKRASGLQISLYFIITVMSNIWQRKNTQGRENEEII